MTPIRLGAVEYLNARPLVWGLDRLTDRFSVRYDVPARCASLLHEGAVDLGLIPSIEYLQRPDYAAVPGVAVASRGTVASVALFTSRAPRNIRTIALDNTSRTSVALLRVLCAERYGIDPQFVTAPPDLQAMTGCCDAALLIGDVALFADHRLAGVEKIDLGEEWLAMTGLPFVYAFWAGRQGVAGPDDVRALQTARDRAVDDLDAVADWYYRAEPQKVPVARRYLRDNVKYRFDGEEVEGLRRFYRAAAKLGIVPPDPELRFYPA
jgi:chorismate dehydratase